MWPTLFEVPVSHGDYTANTYGLLVLLAVAVTIGLVTTRCRQVGIGLDRLLPTTLVACVTGFVGARVLYGIGVGDLSGLFSPSGGYAYYGAILGGTAGVLVMAAWLSVPLLKLLDVAAPSIVLGNGIGRLGCFFAGCCHGGIVPDVAGTVPLLPDGLLKGQLWWHSHFPWISAEFHAGTGRLHDVPLYPTQLWSSLGAFTVAAFGIFMWSRRRFDGQVVAFVLLVEPVVRILIEMFRADHRGYAVSWTVDSASGWGGLARAGASLPGSSGDIVVGITTSQGIGLGFMALGLTILATRWHRGVAPEAPVAGHEDTLADHLLDE